MICSVHKAVFSILAGKVERQKEHVSQLTSQLRVLQSTLSDGFETMLKHSEASSKQSLSWLNSLNSTTKEKKVSLKLSVILETPATPNTVKSNSWLYRTNNYALKYRFLLKFNRLVRTLVITNTILMKKVF